LSLADTDVGAPVAAPIRVMIVNTSLVIGGAEKCALQLATSLDREVFAPQICCLKEAGPLARSLPHDVPCHCDVLNHKYDVRILSRLTRLFREESPHVVLTVGAGDKMFWGRLAAARARVPVIASALHSTGWPDSIGFLNRRLNPLNDAFVALSKSHARHLVRKEHLSESRVHIVPNGVDTDSFSPRPAREDLRHELRLGSEAPVIGIVARLGVEKNHDMLFNAAGGILQKCPAARFLIVGDGPERSRLEGLARQLGIAEAVRFLGARRDVADLYNLMDVCVLTSRMEALPLCILEALASGVPVVATNVGSVPELIAHARHGFLVEPSDKRRLAAYVVDLLKDPAKRREMGAAGREFVLERHTTHHMVRGYEDLFSCLLTAKLQRPAAPAAEVAAIT
jgi:glycosyltransferase involved in cell wall biosynthesis